MSAGDHPPTTRPGRPSLIADIILLMIMLAGCGQGEAEDRSGGAGTDSETNGSDSLAVAADSTDEKSSGGSKGNFLTRIFNRNKDKDDEEEEIVPVEMADVVVQDVPAFLRATATLEPDKQATVLAKIAGEIRRIHVEEGDFVKQGQVLALLDGAVERVRLEEAAARARGFALDLERVERLFDQDLVSTKAMNDSRSRHEEAEAQRKAAELSVSYTRVVAPFSGQVSNRLVDLGQNVSLGTQLFTIVDADPLVARVHLPEKNAARIAIGQPVIINPGDEGDESLMGSVTLISPIVDRRTGTIKVTCEVSGSKTAFRPGSFVRVKLETDRHTDVLVVPKRALIPEGGETYVFMAEGDTVVKVAIKTGFADDEFVEVIDGIVEGDRVITVGQGALRTGTKVRDLDAENGDGK